MTRTYQNQFPDFDLGFDIPTGFEDTSWCNDVCPSFTKTLPDGRHLVLWVQYPNAADRETGAPYRFSLALNDEHGEYLIDLTEGDDLGEVLAWPHHAQK